MYGLEGADVGALEKTDVVKTGVELPFQKRREASTDSEAAAENAYFESMISAALAICSDRIQYFREEGCQSCWRCGC